jgi:hypothetical protein
MIVLIVLASAVVVIIAAALFSLRRLRGSLAQAGTARPVLVGLRGCAAPVRAVMVTVGLEGWRW